MKKSILLLTFVMIFGLLLAACGGGAAEAPAGADLGGQEPQVLPTANVPPTQEPQVLPTADVPPTQEPQVLPTAPQVSDDQLDALFGDFLAGMESYDTLGLEPFNEMLAGDPPFILDVREADELAENGWIEGAVHVPIGELANRTDVLPSPDTPIVVYCGSGWRCTIALPLLNAMGWDNVKSLKGGSFGGWVEAGYPVATGEVPVAEALNAAEVDPAVQARFIEILQAMPAGYGGIGVDDLNTAIAENPDLILIDVRTTEEVEAEGHIDAPNVLFIPIEEFIERRAEWPADKDAPIVVYCGSGHRSTIAMPIMWAYGYNDVLSMKGGFNEWVEAGYATVGAPEGPDLDTAFNTFLGNMEGYNVATLENLNLALAEDPPPFLLDVRELDEVAEAGHIEGAVNLPLREMLDNPAYLPSLDTPITVYCGSGWRCTLAIPILGALGYPQPLSLKEGSFGGWVEAGYPIVEGAAPEPVELNALEPDPAMLATLQETLHNIPEGYGAITVDDLNALLVENPDVILIDVRTEAEAVENGVIEHANHLSIPLEEFINMKDQWPEDLDAPIVLYCGSGHRCTIAAAIMWTYGYTNTLSLRGGIGAWVDAGYPVVDFAPEG
jgi:rhodanese-related sulfurtransferase